MGNKLTCTERYLMANEIARELSLRLRPMLKAIVKEIIESSVAESEDSVDVQGAAKILGVSESWIYKHYDELLPHRKEGRKVLFQPSQLEEYKKKGRTL